MKFQLSPNQRVNVLCALAGLAFGGVVSIAEEAYAVTWRQVSGLECQPADSTQTAFHSGGVLNDDASYEAVVICPLTDDSEGMKRNLVSLDVYVDDDTSTAGLDARLCMMDPWNGSVSCGNWVGTSTNFVGYTTLNMVAYGVRPSGWTDASWDPWPGVIVAELPDRAGFSRSGITMYEHGY